MSIELNNNLFDSFLTREERHRQGSGQEDRERLGRDQQEASPEGTNRKSPNSLSLTQVQSS